MHTSFYSIGVYGLTEDEFFNKLISNQIDTFIDIRRRRAVRGSKYSFVNSNRLQERLSQLGIKYFHILDLAPSNEIRDIQKKFDKENHILKQKREKLGDKFIEEYKKQVLERYNFSDLFLKLDDAKAQKAVLFCVEKEPGACHRSLVTNELEHKFSAHVSHL